MREICSAWKTPAEVEMATVDELVQMMNTLQGQPHALNQEITRMTAETLQCRYDGSPGLAEIATAVGLAAQIAVTSADTRSNERQSLVDLTSRVLEKHPPPNVVG